MGAVSKFHVSGTVGGNAGEDAWLRLQFVVIQRRELPIVHLRIHEKKTDHTAGFPNGLRSDNNRLD